MSVCFHSRVQIYVINGVVVKMYNKDANAGCVESVGSINTLKNEVVVP